MAVGGEIRCFNSTLNCCRFSTDQYACTKQVARLILLQQIKPGYLSASWWKYMHQMGGFFLHGRGLKSFCRWCLTVKNWSSFVLKMPPLLLLTPCHWYVRKTCVRLDLHHVACGKEIQTVILSCSSLLNSIIESATYPLHKIST